MASDKVFEMMKANASWADILEAAGKSAVYAGLAQYFSWAQRRAADLRAEVARLQESNTALDKAEKDVGSSLEAKRREVQDLDAKRTALTSSSNALDQRCRIVKAQVDQLETQLKGLHSRGVTDETIARVGRMEFGDGKEFLQRLDTAETYGKLLDEVNSLGDRKSKLLGECQVQEQRLASLKKEVVAEGNSLDEAKRRTWIWQEAHAIMLGFTQDGYDKELLSSLRAALNVLAIKGRPRTSIKRLLDGLSKCKELLELDALVRSRKAELATLSAELDNARGILRALKEEVIVTARNAGAEAKKEMGDLAASIMSEIEALRKTTEKGILDTGEDGRASVSGIHTMVERILLEYKDEVSKWGDAREQCGTLSEILVYGYRLLGLLKVPEAVKEVPLEVVTQIFDRLHTWTVYMLPEATTTPSPNVIAKQNSLRFFTPPIKLSLLTGWMRDEFNRRLEGAKP